MQLVLPWDWMSDFHAGCMHHQRGYASDKLEQVRTGTRLYLQHEEQGPAPAAPVEKGAKPGGRWSGAWTLPGAGSATSFSQGWSGEALFHSPPGQLLCSPVAAAPWQTAHVGAPHAEHPYLLGTRQ